MPVGQGGISAFPGGAQGEIITWPGIYYGAVSNNADPLKQNRCLLRIPQILGGATTTWASPLTPLVDPPAVGTLVCALFVGGDLDHPVYLVVNPAVPIETNTANVQPVGTTASSGTSHKVAAADHIHTLANALESLAANIQSLGARAAGTSAKAARADHVHVNAVAELDGAAGVLQLTSGTTGVGDAASSVAVMSRNFAAGHSEIDINADNINISANTNFVLSPSSTNTTSSIAGGNTITNPGTSYSQTWAQQVQATCNLMFGAINNLYTSFNNMYNNIYT